MEGGSEVFDILKFEIGNGFSTHIRYAHTERNTEDERTYYEALLMLCCLTIEGVDMQGIVVHSKHAEKRIIILGNRASRPVFVHFTNLKFFKTSAILHFCIPFVSCRDGACPVLVCNHLAHSSTTLPHVEFFGVPEAPMYAHGF